MISFASAAFFLGCIVRFCTRRPIFALAGSFLIWQFLLKILGASYLDLFGPVYEPDVKAYIGGDGSSALLLSLTLFIPMVTLYWSLKASNSSRQPPEEQNLNRASITFSDVAVFIFAAFAVALYFDLLRLGDIPFFSHQDRHDYNARAGIFHQVLYNYSWMVSFVMGYVLTRARIVTGVWDIRIVYIAISLLIYLFLTGNRFGAFLVIATYSAFAIAGFYYAKAKGWAVAPFRRRALGVGSFIPSRRKMAFAAGAFLVFILAAVANNLIFVRAYADPGEAIADRLLVQPIELYWMTFDRFQKGEVLSSSEAIDFMFNDPFDAARNTGVQYLMMLTLGAQQAEYQFNEQGQDYAGGYPEIFLELGGFWPAMLLIMVISIVNAGLYWLAIDSIARGYFLTAVMAAYVGYGVTGIFLGGMLNFILASSYWVKFVALVLAIILDRGVGYLGRRLVPWVLVRRRDSLA